LIRLSGETRAGYVLLGADRDAGVHLEHLRRSGEESFSVASSVCEVRRCRSRDATRYSADRGKVRYNHFPSVVAIGRVMRVVEPRYNL
jgi:hypothetical protein